MEKETARLSVCNSLSQPRDHSIFFKEWLAGGRRGDQFPISAVCNGHCLFCSNNFNPFLIHRGIFRDIEDLKLQLALTPNTAQIIRMSDSAPGRIAEGEAFLHPEFFKILRLIRRKFPTNVITFTTNGSMLDEAFLRELSNFRPIEIAISMHSTRPDLWGRIFGKEPSDAATAFKALKLFRKYRIDLIGTMVVLPRVCGWADIEHTYSTFVSQGAKWMVLWRAGYSRMTAPDTIRELECPIEEFMNFSDRMREIHRVSCMSYPYLRKGLGFDLGKILSATLKGNPRNAFGPYRRVLWLTSEAAQGLIAGELSGRSCENVHNAVGVRNETYGGNIIVSGLLMVGDFIRAGRKALESYPDTELVLVPKMPFDSHECDLTGEPAYRIAEELKRPVWVVETNGFIHSLLEGSFESTDRAPVISMKDIIPTIHSSTQRTSPCL
jgi:uncharacterized Fe-S cluster-containing radical SAM superfamily protein